MGGGGDELHGLFIFKVFRFQQIVFWPESARTACHIQKNEKIRKWGDVSCYPNLNQTST